MKRILLLLLVLTLGCGCTEDPTTAPDAGSTTVDAGLDAGDAASDPADAALDGPDASGPDASSDDAGPFAAILSPPTVVAGPVPDAWASCTDWVRVPHPSPMPPVDAPTGTPTLLFTREYAPTSGYIIGSAVGPDGSFTFFGPGEGMLTRLDRAGMVVWSVDIGTGAARCTIAPDGSVYFAVRDETMPPPPLEDPDVATRLVVIGNDGAARGDIAFDYGPPMYGITRVAVGPGGRIWLARGVLTGVCADTLAHSDVGLLDGVGEPLRALSVSVDASDRLLLATTLWRAARVDLAARTGRWLGGAFDGPSTANPSLVRDDDVVVETEGMPWLESPGETAILLGSFFAIDRNGRELGGDIDDLVWSERGIEVQRAPGYCLQPFVLPLEDGGILCPRLDELVRLGPDGAPMWTLPFDGRGYDWKLHVDVDGRLLVVTDSSLTAYQTNAQPAHGMLGYSSNRHGSNWVRDYR